MSEEFEVKYLNIDPTEIEAKLKKLGARKEFDRLYKVRVFDYPGFPLNEKASWLRLRDEGDKVTLAYKQRIGDLSDRSGKTNDQGMIEHEVIVSDFDKTIKLLHAIGMIDKYVEEKRRIRYKLKGIEFDIDFMPAIQPFLEIEASSWEKVDEGIRLLELDPSEKKIFSAHQIYSLAGIKMFDYKELTFGGLVKRD